MIGTMSGPMSGAIGEGMSDVLALGMNRDDRMGEYSSSDALGIRSAPTPTFPRTYGASRAAKCTSTARFTAPSAGSLLELHRAAANTDLLPTSCKACASPAARTSSRCATHPRRHRTNDCKVWTASPSTASARRDLEHQRQRHHRDRVVHDPAGVCP